MILSPLHIKLGLTKQFMKALNKEGDRFKCIKEMFPKLNDEKVEESISSLT